MIKAEDLRIGDLVRINENCSLKEGVISYITEIRTRGIFEKEDCVKLKHFDSDWGFGVWCRNIDPIPLTPEILEKNGFEMREGTVVYAKNRLALKPLDEGKGYQVYQIGLGSLRLFYVEVRFVKYVHELQHILWALGKDANLKV